MNYRKISIIISFAIILGSTFGCLKNKPAEQTPVENNTETVITAEPTPQACSNIFYPLVLDNQWIYQFTYQDPSAGSDASDLGMTVSEASESSAVLAVLDYDTGIVTQSTAKCQNGAIINFPLTELNMVFGDLAGDLALQYVSGLFMPSEQDFLTGEWQNKWETEFTASGEMSGSFEGDSLTAKLSSSPVKMEWQVASTGESLQVLAGSFTDVVKINREISIDVTSLKGNFEGNAVDIATTLVINSDMWYAPHVGLIKQELKSASVKLFGINFPIETAGIVELKSYKVQ
jgi:hypothetical protein